MALLDSKFVVEVIVEDFKSYVSSKDFTINCQFAGIFNSTLKIPNELRKVSKGMKNNRKKIRERNSKTDSERSVKGKPRNEKSISFVTNTHSLIYAMRKFNIDLSLFSKDVPVVIIGSTSIPWNQECIDYITSLVLRNHCSSATQNGEYCLYDDATTKCVAKIKLNLKLSCLKFNNIVERMTTQAAQLDRPSDFELHLTKNDHRTKENALEDYNCGEKRGPYANQVYCMNYVTVQSDPTSSAHSSTSKSSQKVSASLVSGTGQGSSNEYKLNKPIGNKVLSVKCRNMDCNKREHRKVPNKADNDKIFIDVSGASKICSAAITEKVEEVMGTMRANMSFGDNNGKPPCLCACECTFGIVKKTTLCTTCGGYETAGEDFNARHYPCPIFHKLVDKNKLKTLSTSGSDIKKKGPESQRTVRSVSPKLKSPETKKKGDETPGGLESEGDRIGKKNKKDNRFKFNYGYKAPHIGHDQCGIGCGASFGPVPKNMGWLWTAGDIPGLKFRPNWKPGASNKHVVRMLKIARDPGVISKKRKKVITVKNKRPPNRPLLIVHKKNGEYNITMETMKQYAKPRTHNQLPYEDKPVVTYTIGRTAEENRDRKKKKERKQRRLERDQRDFIQSTFKNMCHEICLKTYQQALGILPDAEDPECTCYPAQPDPNKVNMDMSCSCSEDDSSVGSSDTDSDEWIVEITPPNAKFESTYKYKKALTTDNATQYTYLDYRAKLLDFSGKQVPRFFKGPDGKQQCSDLGAFKDLSGNWLHINVDGFIAPDGKWAPKNFFGPNGEEVEARLGKFQASNGDWLVVGIDGYVDEKAKWKYYSRPTKKTDPKRIEVADKKDGKLSTQKSAHTWSCFGDASSIDLGRMGIMGHGADRKRLLERLKGLLAQGDLGIKLPQPPTVQRAKGKTSRPKKMFDTKERAQYRHPEPSKKGVLATDRLGNKKYFRLKAPVNYRAKSRIADLHHQGISVSSFHMPCYHSSINIDNMHQQQYKSPLSPSRKDHVSIATQI